MGFHHDHGWSADVRKRVSKDHARKKAARKQRQHLERIKSPTELRTIMLAGRRRQK